MNMTFDEVVELTERDPIKVDPKSFPKVSSLRGLHGETVLHYCAIEGMCDAVKHLVGLGADVNATSKYGSTPVMDAALNGHVDIVRLLVKNGADLSARNNVGDNLNEQLQLLKRAKMLRILEEALKER